MAILIGSATAYLSLSSLVLCTIVFSYTAAAAVSLHLEFFFFLLLLFFTSVIVTLNETIPSFHFILFYLKTKSQNTL